MMPRPLALLLLCCINGAAAAQQQVVLYGDDDYPPYSYVERGEFKGIYVDLLKQAAGLLFGEEIMGVLGSMGA